MDLVQTHDIAANLGECEVELGQAREAAEHLTFALRTFRISGKEEVRARLMQLLAEARKKVGALRVAVNVEGAEVRVNGRPVGRAPIAEEVFVDPGPVTVEGRLAGYVNKAETITVAAGEERHVQVALVRETTPPVVGPAVTAPASAQAQKSFVPVYIGVGVAGAAAVTGIVLTAISNGASTEANEIGAELDRAGAQCPSTTHAAECEALRSSLERLDTFGNAAIGTMVLGGAALIGTMAYVLYWPAPDPKPRTTGSHGRWDADAWAVLTGLA